MDYFIGLDAHSTTSTFAVVDEKGKCVLRNTVKTSEQNLFSVIKRVQGGRHLTFEESTISQWLWLSLRDKVDKLLVCNPVYVAKKPGAKTDFRDALHLAQELRTGHLQGRALPIGGCLLEANSGKDVIRQSTGKNVRKQKNHV